MAIHITDNPEADELLSTNPFALLVGMMLDQRSAWPLTAPMGR